MAAWRRNALSPGGCWTTHPGPPPGRTSLSTTARRICREEMVSLVGSAVNCLSAKKRPPAAQQQCPLLPWMSWLTHCNCCGGSTSRSASTSTLPAVFSCAAFCCRGCGSFAVSSHPGRNAPRACSAVVSGARSLRYHRSPAPCWYFSRQEQRSVQRNKQEKAILEQFHAKTTRLLPIDATPPGRPKRFSNLG